MPPSVVHTIEDKKKKKEQNSLLVKKQTKWTKPMHTFLSLKESFVTKLEQTPWQQSGQFVPAVQFTRRTFFT